MMIDVNGSLFGENEFSISPLDSGFYYGFSIYETCFVTNSKIAFYEEHINRLKKSASYFNLPLNDFFYDNLKQRIINLILTNSIFYGRLRIIISPGIYSEINNPLSISSIITMQKINITLDSISLFISSIKKPYPALYPSFVKISANLLSLQSYLEAKKFGFDEGVMLTKEGIITEGSYCNLFWIKNEKIYTPSIYSSILEGVTRSKIIEAAKLLGINVIESEFYEIALFDSDHLFISSSTRGLLKVFRLGKKLFHSNNPEIIEPIQKKYNELLLKSLEEFT